MTISTARVLAVLATLTTLTTHATAGEVYGAIGVPGLTLGYSHPVNASLGVRGEASTLGTRKHSTTENGITYNGELRGNRASLLGDWFVAEGGWRITGGLAFSDYKFTLDGSGSAGTIAVGNTIYNTTAADGLLVEVKFPKLMPYLGLGWGHHAASGWRLGFDLGAYIGKGKLTVTPRGQLALPAAQNDVNAEVEQLRQGAGKVNYLPQLGVNVGYSF